ncbi:MAG: hypothetical protein U0793_08030 [Gemmataceae bacterium]
MNPLHHRIAWLRRQLYFFAGARGLFAVAGLLVGAGLVACLLDWMIGLPSMIRAFLLAGILVGSAYVAFRLLLQPLLAPKDDLSLALQVEAAYPHLNDSLASTVEFLKQPGNDPMTGSAAMRNKAVEQALGKSKELDFGRILDRRGAVLACAGFLVAAGLAAFFMLDDADTAWTAVRRLADPFGNHTWTRLDIPDLPDHVAVGKPFIYKTRVDGVIPKSGKLIVEGQKKVDEIAVLTDAEGAYIDVNIPLTREPGAFRFRVTAGDASFPAGPGTWQKIDVLPPPDLKFVRVEVAFPEYTEEPPAVIYEGETLPKITHQHFVPGSVVRLRAQADKPLADAWVQLLPLADARNPNPGFRACAIAGLFGGPPGAEGLPLAAGAFSVYGRFPARFLDDSRRTFEVEFPAWISGRYVLHLEDFKKLDREINTELNLMSDPPPGVILSLTSPDTRFKEDVQVDVRPDVELDMVVSAKEDQYWLRSVFLEFSPRSGVEEEPLRVGVFDQKEMSRLLPILLGAPLEEIKVRLQRIERAPVRWGLKNRYKEGEVVSLSAAAFDSCNIFPSREPGRSKTIKLRIVGVRELLVKEEKVLPDAQINIDKAREILEGAVKGLKEVASKNPEDLKREDLEKLAEAELDQARAKAHLEQLLDQINKLALTRKLNKLPSSDAGDLLKTLREELDALVQEEMPKIENDISDAKAKLSGLDPKKAKAEKSSKDDPLKSAIERDDKAKAALDDLSRALAPYASLQMVKDKAKELLLKHTDLRDATDKLLEMKDKIDRGDVPMREVGRATKELNDETAKKGEAQASLADKADELFKLMLDVAKKRAADKDMENARKLEKAADIGGKTRVSERMRDVGGELKKPPAPLNRAKTEQENIRAALDRIDKILNDKKPTDDVDRLSKKKKKTDDNLDKLDKLGKGLADLREKAAKAMEIKDADKRKAALDKIAKDEEKLKKDAEDAARELARLNEPKAAKALADAAAELDKAGAKMKAGDNPDAEIEAAMEKVEGAKERLEMTQEELAREQLAQVGELIKGLKERQDAAIARTEELQKKLLGKKIWSEGLLDSLNGDVLVQRGLSKETRSIKEKLKGAVVFEDIMEKAARSMERAAEEMDKRKEEAKHRQVDMMTMEELADEAKRHEETKKHQDLASARLGRLLDAIKNEPPVVKKEGPKKDGPPKKDDPEGGGGAGESIPPVAQLKALKAEQIEVRARTKEFDARHPDRARLPEDALRELRELQEDQVRIHQLFEEMTAPPEKKGAMP